MNGSPTGRHPYMVAFLDGNGEAEGFEEFDDRAAAEAELFEASVQREDGTNPEPAILYMRLARTVQPPLEIERDADAAL